MNPRRKSRLSIIIFVILGISIATGLVLYALRQNIDLFYTPSEVIEGKEGKADQKPEVGQRIRVGGMVVEGTVKRDPKSLKVRFNYSRVRRYSAGSFPRGTGYCCARCTKRTNLIRSNGSAC